MHEMCHTHSCSCPIHHGPQPFRQARPPWWCQCFPASLPGPGWAQALCLLGASFLSCLLCPAVGTGCAPILVQLPKGVTCACTDLCFSVFVVFVFSGFVCTYVASLCAFSLLVTSIEKSKSPEIQKPYTNSINPKIQAFWEEAPGKIALSDFWIWVWGVGAELRAFPILHQCYLC